MGVFEKLPYLNYHDINLDWLVRQTKKNASDNNYLMQIFKWFQDQGLVGTVTNVTENPDDTVKIDYADVETMTTDDFTVYDKTGADNAISVAQSAAEGYADNAIANAFKGLGDLPAETDLQDTDLLLINRSGVAEAIAGDVVAKQSDMDTAEGNISDLQGRMTTAEGTLTNLTSGSTGSGYTKLFDGTMICWGTDTTPDSSGTMTLTFPQSFINNTYSIVAMGFYNSSINVDIVYGMKQVGSVPIYLSPGNAGQVVSWIAIGRWKA